MTENTNATQGTEKQNTQNIVERISGGGLLSLFLLTMMDTLLLFFFLHWESVAEIASIVSGIGVTAWAIIYHGKKTSEQAKIPFLRINFALLILMILLVAVQDNSSASYPTTIAERNRLALEGLQRASDAKDAKCRAHPEWC